MTEFSFPFADQSPDTNDGRPYTDAEIRQWHRAMFMQDNEDDAFQVEGAGNELVVSAPAANTIRVGTGAAMVDGFGYVNDANEDLSVSNAPSGQSRRDRVILKADWSNYQVRLEIKEGTSGTVPSLTQTRNTTWEVSLAYFDVDDVGAITNLTSEVNDDAHLHFGTRVSTAMLDALAVTEAKLGALAVTEGKIGALAVTAAKLAADAVETAKIKNLNVTGAKLAADSVDDTKAGNRIIQFRRRQGGSATHWATGGSTDYTPGAVQMQAGAYTASISAANSGSVDITFPEAFGYVPLNFVTPLTGNLYVLVGQAFCSTTTLRVYWSTLDGSNITAFGFNWMAIGPEA